MVHDCLGIRAVLLSKFKQVKALLQTLDGDLVVVLDIKAFSTDLNDLKRLCHILVVRRLIKQVVDLIVVDLIIAASDVSLLLSFGEHLNGIEQVQQAVDQNTLVRARVFVQKRCIGTESALSFILGINIFSVYIG